MKNEVKGKALVDFEKIIKEVNVAAYDDGHTEGYKQGLEDIPDGYIEKLNTEYTVKQFSECVTLSDFQDKLKEITNRSYNFMT